MLKEALDVYHENIQKTLQELFNRPSTSSANTERSSTKSTAKSPSVDTQSGEKMKELGVPGSGIFITKTQWAAAKSKDTWAAMLNSLLTSLFDEEILLASNYKSGKPKIKSDNPIQLKALDSAKLDVIKTTLKEYFPKQFRDGDFGKSN
ncbi:GSCOCG00012211001-RA-CDS [Cotesia congregata]|nr:GSCOCG00012211001-RA-CDS [Cotesia congregata]